MAIKIPKDTDAALANVSSAPIDYGNESGAADQLSKIVAGNQHLITNPHLVTALMMGNATAQQAQAVNLLATGMQTAQRVAAAQADGTKIMLTAQESSAAAAVGVNVGNTEFTKADFQKQVQAQIDAQDKPADSGWSFGRVWHDAFHNDVTDVVGKGLNYAQTAFTGNVGGGGSNTTPGAQSAQAQAMIAAGYDPTSKVSTMAYDASGINLGNQGDNLTDLYAKYGADQMNAAIKYTDDPHAYIAAILYDPNSTPEQIAAKLQALDDTTPAGKAFKDLTQRVMGDRATIGTQTAQDLQLDPVKNATAFKVTAIATDVAVSFIIDPTMLALSGYKAFRATQIMLDGLGDENKVRKVLGGTAAFGPAANVRRGVQSFLDNANAMREAKAAGDDVALAQAYTRINTLTPSLVHLLDDFHGIKQAAPALNSANKIVFTAGKPITTMAEATDYFASKTGMVRLMSGRAPSEVGLMPGQLSLFGVKRLQSALSQVNIRRGVQQAAARVTAFNLAKPGEAARILPAEGDAFDAAAAAPDSAVADGLASAARGSADAGNALFESRQGFTPAAVWARAKIVGRRMGSFLPEDTAFDTNDVGQADKIFRYANMYLTRSDAAITAARYALGDEGVRKQILTSMQLQTMHAAGFAVTEQGRELINRAAQALDTQHYSNTADKIIDAAGNERDAALMPGQVNDALTLINFRDLQTNAAKIGIWENTLGRVFKYPLVDNLMSVVKINWLTTGSNVVRNAGEDLFSKWTKGEFAGTLRAKAAAKNADLLPDRLTDRLLLDPLARSRFGQSRAGRIAAQPAIRVAQLWRYGLRSVAGDAGRQAMQYIADLDPEVMAQFGKDYASKHLRSMVDPAGVGDTDEISRAGLSSRRMRFVRTGYEKGTTEDLAGAERLSNALAVAINKNPDLVNAILDHIEDPLTNGIDHVVDTLSKDSRLKSMIRNGHYDDPAGSFERIDKATPQVVTAADQAVATRQLAEKQVTEIRYLMSGAAGDLNQHLADFVRENGKAPDTDWVMENLVADERPPTVYAPMYEAVPVGGKVANFVGAVADLSGEAYKHLVDRPIARVSSMPIFLDNYGRSRVFMRDWEQQLVEGGMTKSAANKAATNIAMEMAYKRTLRYIDDPTLQTQMDVVGRNFFAFSRATQAFVRRWATQFIENPAQLRKASLAMEAGVKTGLVYTDPNGQQQFIFPGSGAAVNAIMQVADIIPGVDLLRVPGMAPNMTGKVAFLSPGLQNPLQMSATPIVNIPMRAVFGLFPQHKVGLDWIDEHLNGSQGQGQGALASIEPTAVKKFTDALNSNDRDSLMADATRSAMLNLSAAGKVPAATADGAQKQQFLADLQTQVKNQLLVRAIFGYFTPAPPGIPSEDTTGSQADWYFGAAGVHGLSAEYKTMLNDTGGDVGRTNQIWSALHPDKQMYEVSSSEGNTKSGYIAATQQSQSWMMKNLNFMQGYKGVSAYFVPKDLQNGKFDLTAYNAEFELGIRQHKTTSDFYNDVVTANSAAVFYQALDARDQALQENPNLKSTIDQNFSDWSKQFNSLNPLFAQTQTDWSQAVLTAQDQLAQLKRMVADPNLPSDVPVAEVQKMLGVYDSYHAAVQQYPRSTNQDLAAKAQLAGQYNDWWQQEMAANPDLAGLYVGVFRTLDNKVLDPIGS